MDPPPVPTAVRPDEACVDVTDDGWQTVQLQPQDVQGASQEEETLTSTVDIKDEDEDMWSDYIDCIQCSQRVGTIFNSLFATSKLSKDFISISLEMITISAVPSLMPRAWKKYLSRSYLVCIFFSKYVNDLVSHFLF